MRHFAVLIIVFFVLSSIGEFVLPQIPQSSYLYTDSIIKVMERVNDHFIANEWKQNDRNWIRATYYTGLMAFYHVTEDTNLLKQIHNWGEKHGWRIGSEWIYPANRLTCSQTWLQLYEIDPNADLINNTRAYMDKRVEWDEEAFEAGWDYVDALYVGAPAYFMMSSAQDDPGYKIYADRIFKEVTAKLYDKKYGLFYRDLKASNDISDNGKPVFWSRGNGWAFAAIPRILQYLPQEDTLRDWYVNLFTDMAQSLLNCQGEDGFWRSNLLDPNAYPNPESSGTAFFTYGLAWGINNGILDKPTYLPFTHKAWYALYSAVDEAGKVCWGQDVARKPENVNKEDSREYVSGAFLLAASEIFKLSLSENR